MVHSVLPFFVLMYKSTGILKKYPIDIESKNGIHFFTVNFEFLSSLSLLKDEGCFLYHEGIVFEQATGSGNRYSKFFTGVGKNLIKFAEIAHLASNSSALYQ